MRLLAMIGVGLLLSLIPAKHWSANEPLTKAAVLSNDAIARDARAQLRAKGPDGLAELMDANRDHIREHLEGRSVTNWPEIAEAIDSVAKQRDAWASGLFWYTDLEEAKAVARQTGKPILSLRLLGSLDSELSCANSRFFRTTLYSAPEVSKRMRENFVLHWSSERPVPVVTVDFGDGRTLKRTVTGNSAHYVLLPDGRPIDVLPGLYSAKAFVDWLDDVSRFAGRLVSAPEEARDSWVRAYHSEKLKQAPHPRRNDPLDPAAVAVIRSKQRNAVAAGRISLAKCQVEDPLARMLVALQGSIAEDTARNESILHANVHEWFAKGTAPRDFESLNRRVYAVLFLTPRSDPWLGLAPADAWSALDGDGLR